MEGTIYESFTLPSKGMVYDKKINPNVTLRSMTTMDEMKRLSPTDTPYRAMSDIIESCMRDKPDIHVYDMCISDYQFLLHKLRIVTYGPEYKMTYQCPKCGEFIDSITNLEELEIEEWNDSFSDSKMITLPKTQHLIEMRLQTPRDLDMIAFKTREMKKKTKQNVDYSILYTLTSLIKKIDGQERSSIAIEEFVKELPNLDATYLINRSTDLIGKFGIASKVKVNCTQCNSELELPFRITSEFFGPTNV